MNFFTERLRLRPLCLDDLPTVHEYAGDVENTKYMIFLPNATEQESEAFLRKVEEEQAKQIPDFYEFAIVLDDLQVGAISISLDESRTQGEIGWILNKKYWNQGYATEAARAILEFAKDELKLQEVIACCDWRNLASAKVMEKIGMTLIDDKGQRTYMKWEETARELTYRIVLN